MLLEGCRVPLPPVVEVPSLAWLPKGVSLICLGTKVSTLRRYKTTANSRDRYSNECRNWKAVRIDHLLSTEPVSPRPSRLANVRYCLSHLFLIRNADGE